MTNFVLESSVVIKRVACIFVVKSCIRIKGGVKLGGLSPTALTPPPHTHTQSSFPTDRSEALPLLQFFFVCASVVSYVAFVFFSLFIPHLSFV